MFAPNADLVANVYAIGTPERMAWAFARYMSDPSTVRAALINHFGRGRLIPDDGVILSFIEQHRKSRARPDNDEYADWDEPQPEPAEPEPVEEPEPAPPPPLEIIPGNPFTMPVGRSKAVIRAVADDCNISYDDLVSSRRYQFLTHPRALAAKLLRDWGLSYPAIANALNRADHSTIIHMIDGIFPVAMRKREFAKSYHAFRWQMHEAKAELVSRAERAACPPPQSRRSPPVSPRWRIPT